MKSFYSDPTPLTWPEKIFAVFFSVGFLFGIPIAIILALQLEGAPEWTIDVVIMAWPLILIIMIFNTVVGRFSGGVSG